MVTSFTKDSYLALPILQLVCRDFEGERAGADLFVTFVDFGLFFLGQRYYGVINVLLISFGSLNAINRALDLGVLRYSSFLLNVPLEVCLPRLLLVGTELVMVRN